MFCWWLCFVRLQCTTSSTKAHYSKEHYLVPNSHLCTVGCIAIVRSEDLGRDGWWPITRTHPGVEIVCQAKYKHVGFCASDVAKCNSRRFLSLSCARPRSLSFSFSFLFLSCRQPHCLFSLSFFRLRCIFLLPGSVSSVLHLSECVSLFLLLFSCLSLCLSIYLSVSPVCAGDVSLSLSLSQLVSVSSALSLSRALSLSCDSCNSPWIRDLTHAQSHVLFVCHSVPSFLHVSLCFKRINAFSVWILHCFILNKEIKEKRIVCVCSVLLSVSVSILLSVSVFVFMSVSVSMSVSVPISMSASVSVSVLMSVYMSVSVSVSMSVSVSVSVSVSTSVSVSVSVSASAYLPVFVCTYMCTCT